MRRRGCGGGWPWCGGSIAGRKVNVKKGKTCAQANRLEDFGERGEEKAGQGRGWCGKKGEETFFMERKMQFSENSERMDVRYVAALARIALEEGEAQRLEDVGNGITLPTEATFSTNNGCADGTTRRLIGWIKASDLATYASGRRVDMIDDLKTGDASNKVIAPGTKVQATGVTWYAVWGKEKE